MFAKTAEKTAWRVIADPVAEERQWMAAATVVGEKAPPQAKETLAGKLPDNVHGWLSGTIAAVASMGLFFISFTMMNQMGAALGIDENITTFSTWVRAVFCMMAIPSMGCALAGYLHRVRAPEQKFVWLLPALPWAILGVWASTSMGIWGAIIFAAGVVVSRLSFCLGRSAAQWWHRHKCRIQLAGPALPLLYCLSLLLWCVIAHHIITHGPSSDTHNTVESGLISVQVLGYITVFFSFMAALSCRSRQFGTTMLAAFTVQTPLLLFYAISLGAGAVYSVASAATGSFDANVLLIACLSFLLTSSASAAGAALSWLILGFRKN